MKVISFPGGSGGNWLRTIVNNTHVPNVSHINFHDYARNKNFYEKTALMVHELDPEKFDYLFSGQYYFNFFVNLVYKHFYYEKNFTQTTDYKDYYTECINAAKFILKFDKIKQHTFFKFDDLVHNDTNFFNCIKTAFPDTKISYLGFVDRKNLFFNSCVRTDEIYENFDNQIWVTFVLGQLMEQDIFPTDFSIYEKSNQALASRFAEENYKHCSLTQVHHFTTKRSLPKLL